VAHRIAKTEDIAAALLRLAGEDLTKARRAFTGDKTGEARIHSTRQHLKRVRTLLRVFEAAPSEHAKAARHSLTAIARMLASARDADVAAESARELTATAPRAVELGFDRVVAVLEEEAAHAHRHKVPPAEVDQRLADLAEEVAALSKDAWDGQALLETAIERAYRRGRRWMHRARESQATPDLHSWRKSVKDLWHLLSLARRRISRKGQVAEPVVERLANLLGLDHDHAVLAERLALSPTGDLSLMAQLALIGDRRREVEAESFELGDGIYGESPKEFVQGLDLG
jgi:CHAD domain-containing protein